MSITKNKNFYLLFIFYFSDMRMYLRELFKTKRAMMSVVASAVPCTVMMESLIDEDDFEDFPNPSTVFDDEVTTEGEFLQLIRKNEGVILASLLTVIIILSVTTIFLIFFV